MRIDISIRITENLLICLYKYSHVFEVFALIKTYMILLKENHYNRTKLDTDNMVHIGINRYALLNNMIIDILKNTRFIFIQYSLLDRL